MDCPLCSAPMREEIMDGHLGRPVVLDLCLPCQSFWFDARESLSLTPGATLTLFRIIGERVRSDEASASSISSPGLKPRRSGRDGPQAYAVDTAKCPRCKSRLRQAHDMQRGTRFTYLSCPHGHGRLTAFFDFLREKDFIRPLTAQQIDELRRNVQMVNCSNCGAAVDLGKESACSHCASPLSMLDIKQAESLVAQLYSAEQTGKTIDPTLPLQLERARREVHAAFDAFEREPFWFDDVSSSGLVGAGLSAIARWMKRPI